AIEKVDKIEEKRSPVKHFGLGALGKDLECPQKIQVILADKEDEILGRNVVDLIVFVNCLKHGAKRCVGRKLIVQSLHHLTSLTGGGGRLLQRKLTIRADLVLLLTEQSAVRADDIAVFVRLQLGVVMDRL